MRRQPNRRSGRDPGLRPCARTTAKPRKQGRKHYPQSPCRRAAGLDRSVAVGNGCRDWSAVRLVQPPRVIGPLAANLTKATVPGELGVQAAFSGATIVASWCHEPLPVALAYWPVPVSW
jgi:hypothetical protein